MNLRLEDRGGKMDMKPNQTKPNHVDMNQTQFGTIRKRKNFCEMRSSSHTHNLCSKMDLIDHIIYLAHKLLCAESAKWKRLFICQTKRLFIHIRHSQIN